MSKRKLIVSIVTICLLAAIAIGAFVMARRSRPKPPEPKTLPEGMEYLIDGKVAVAHFTFLDDQEFFVDDWDGDYDIQVLHGLDTVSSWSSGKVLDYEDYLRFCTDLKSEGYVQAYDAPSLHYLVYRVWWDDPLDTEVRLAAVTWSETLAEVYFWERPVMDSGKIPGFTSCVIVVPTDRDTTQCSFHQLDNTLDDYDKLKQEDQEHGEFEPAEKPVIYLYPEEETEVTVTLGHPECITHSYPAYDDPWCVSAQPDGTLTDSETGRQLYSLYYENVSPIPLLQTDEGFVVRGEDTAAFLEDKLAALGLNEREAEEFIIYWLPRLEDNAWNYIRFASREEIDAEMPLEISPQPDSVIRVLMLYMPLDFPIAVREQTLTTPERTGFTAVEWGGAELTGSAVCP